MSHGPSFTRALAFSLIGIGALAVVLPIALRHQPVSYPHKTPDDPHKIGPGDSRPRTPVQAAAKDEPTSARSETCGDVVGETVADRNAALSFCRKGVAKGIVTGVVAQQSLLTILITRDAAYAMRMDRLIAEQLVHTWMRGWKIESGSQAVSLTIKYGDVEIATGETTLFRGDQVTVR